MLNKAEAGLYNSDNSQGTSSGAKNSGFGLHLADDVLMLRKGLARSILQIFESNTHCPVLVYTACTAEDALRMMSRTAFDLAISDNQFAPPTGLRLLEENTTR